MGRGFAADGDDSVQFVKMLAELGHAGSLRTMGHLHFWGARGVQRDAGLALGEPHLRHCQRSRSGARS